MRDEHEPLRALRSSRGFDAREVLDAKLCRLNRWFAAEKLNAAVVGLSGGVDSALVLGLLMAASKQAGSALRKVVPLLLPVAGPGATGQEAATERGRRVAAALGAEAWHVPLGPALAATVGALSNASGLAFSPWSEGQCLSIMRTPALYGAAALLQTHGFRSVVVGTTNRDEGAYLGFFGKASDGMVDVQPISDLHKSEVRSLALLLGVPSDIVSSPPSGDVFDGRSDEQMIGTTYDAIEAVLRLLELDQDPAQAGAAAWQAVSRQHAANLHKYLGTSVAVHLDVMPRGIPGGWRDESFAGRGEQRPPSGVLLGEWRPPPLPLDEVRRLPQCTALPLPEGIALRAHAVLSHADCQRLIAAMHDSGKAEVWVRPLSGAGQWQVSHDGGETPIWSRDGRELYYVDGDTLMAAPVRLDRGFESGAPRALFTADFKRGFGGARAFDVSRDGRFLLLLHESARQRGIQLIANWGTELGR